MSEISITDTHVIFSTEKDNKPLLNICDYLENKSRIPMHAIDGATETIPGFLAHTVEQNRALFPELTSAREILYLTVNTLLVAELIKSPAPLKVAELGSTYGDISYNLAQTLGKFNPENSLCLISNTVGNDSGNNCLNLLLHAEPLPEFSLVYADYLKTNLANQCFDITFINGDVSHEDHYSLIKEAERMTKPNGLLLCHTAGDSLLESCFQLIFSDNETYEIATGTKLFVAQNKNTWSNGSEAAPYDRLHALVASINEKLSGTASPEDFRSDIKQLEVYIATAISLYDITKKLDFIHLKDCVLDYMNHYSTEHRDFYKERLLQKLIHL